VTRRGTITLEHLYKPIDVKQYLHPAHRASIIRKWIKLYSHTFFQCAIIIAPEINEKIKTTKKHKQISHPKYRGSRIRHYDY